MNISKYRNTQVTSTRGAQPRVVTQPRPTMIRARNERYIDNGGVQQAVDDFNTSTAIIGAVTQGIQKYNNAVDKAEAQSQSTKAVSEYQKGVAQLRAEQLQKPLFEDDDQGNRIVHSQSFAEQYQLQSDALVEKITAGGLTNQNAIKIFDANKSKIDSKYINDIQKDSLNARKEIATIDSLDALSTAVSEKQVDDITDTMVQNKLVSPEKGEALKVKHTQDLTYRRSIQAITMIGNGAAKQGSDEYYANTTSAFDAAYANVISGKISTPQFNTIAQQIRKVEDDRAKAIENRREYDYHLLNVSLNKAKADGSASTLAKDILSNPDAAKQLYRDYGAKRASAMHNSLLAIAKGGTADVFTQQQASVLAARYLETNDPEDYKAVTDYMDANAGNLAGMYQTLRSKISTSRNNNQSERLTNTMAYVKSLMAFKTETDINGRVTEVGAEDVYRWNADLRNKLANEDPDNPVNLNAYFFSSHLDSMQYPQYASSKGLLEFDRKTALDYVNSEYEKGVQDTSPMQQSNGVYSSADEWVKYETQLIDQLNQMSRTLRGDKNILSSLDESVRHKFGIVLEDEQ